jgi:hypothetical protein
MAPTTTFEPSSPGWLVIIGGDWGAPSGKHAKYSCQAAGTNWSGLTLRSRRSDAYSKRENDADPDDQNGQRNWVVFEQIPISSELMHDDPMHAILVSRPMASGMAFASLVASAGRKVQNGSWPRGECEAANLRWPSLTGPDEPT